VTQKRLITLLFAMMTSNRWKGARIKSPYNAWLITCEWRTYAKSTRCKLYPVNRWSASHR